MELSRRSSFILWVVGLVLLAGVVVVSLVRDRIVANPQWTVSVTGHGKVVYKPDIARVMLGVQVDKAAKAENALNDLNKSVNGIMAALKERNIAESDIATQSYSLYPQYEYINDRNIIVGYGANQQISVKVKIQNEDTENIGAVISAATAAGANQILGVSFEASNVEDLKQQARIMAIDDAQAKAVGLAGAADIELDDIVGWWENVVYAPNMYAGSAYYADGKGGAGGPSVPSGDREIVIDMNVTYQIE